CTMVQLLYCTNVQKQLGRVIQAVLGSYFRYRLELRSQNRALQKEVHGEDVQSSVFEHRVPAKCNDSEFDFTGKRRNELGIQRQDLVSSIFWRKKQRMDFARH